jgi:arylsulfatase A-like enzyme
MVYPRVVPKGTRIANLVSLIDVFPTIIDVSHVEDWNDDIQGKSLTPFEDREVHDFVCAECGEAVTARPTDSVRFQQLRPKLAPYDKGFKCLRTKSYKYIISADQKEELYDIQKDPLETVNLASKTPDQAIYLRKQLADTLDLSFYGHAPRETSTEKEREQMLKRLQSLGYI